MESFFLYMYIFDIYSPNTQQKRPYHLVAFGGMDQHRYYMNLDRETKREFFRSEMVDLPGKECVHISKAAAPGRFNRTRKKHR